MYHVDILQEKIGAVAMHVHSTSIYNGGTFEKPMLVLIFVLWAPSEVHPFEWAKSRSYTSYVLQFSTFSITS
jgi:hypothetical protein